MSLLFPYRQLPARQPIVSLGGRQVRPRPIITVTVIGSSGSSVQRALLDTGADDTVFPDTVASRIGLDLSNAPVGEATGVTTGPVPLHYAQVTLRLTDGNEQREWQAWVGFSSAQMNRPLLGFAGCLQFFSAHFHGDREEVELTVNSLYKGT